MSAAEKLKALGPQPQQMRGDALAEVLPQIVALVVWAEKFSDVTDYHGWTDERHPRLEPELDDALAALDEALK